MRILIAGSLIAAAFMVALVASPVIAQEQPIGCVEVAVEWTEGSPILTGILHADEGVRTAIVGDYLWIQYNSDGTADSLNNVASVQIPVGATTASVCMSMHDVAGPDLTPDTIEQVEVIVPQEVPLTVTTVPLVKERWVKVPHGWLIV